MIENKDRLYNLIDKLRNNGYRITPQRIAILRTVIGNKDHLSVEEIYNQVHTEFPMMGLATVYKSIALLKEIGAITELKFLNHNVRYDGSGETPHPHIICINCKSVRDLNSDLEFGRSNLSNLPREIYKNMGYKITHFRMDFYGICPECQKENQFTKL